MKNNRIIKDKLCGVILAAGYGRRMAPLSSFMPKPLLPVLGKPLINTIAKKLIRSGASSLHVNTHHLSESFDEGAISPDLPVTFHTEDRILDTGGGIGNMADSLNNFELILIHNGDIISNIDYAPAIDFHQNQNALITLILTENGENNGKKSRKEVSVKPALFSPPPQIEISDKMRIVGIRSKRRDESDSIRLAGYTGMAILSREALRFFPSGRNIGLIEILLEIIKKNEGRISGYIAGSPTQGILWSDIGSPESYLELHRRILIEQVIFDPEIVPPALPLHSGPNAEIARDTTWRGFLEIGSGAVIEQNCELENCVILPETIVKRGTKVKNRILFPEGQLEAKGL